MQLPPQPHCFNKEILTAGLSTRWGNTYFLLIPWFYYFQYNISSQIPDHAIVNILAPRPNPTLPPLLINWRTGAMSERWENVHPFFILLWFLYFYWNTHALTQLLILYQPPEWIGDVTFSLTIQALVESISMRERWKLILFIFDFCLDFYAPHWCFSILESLLNTTKMTQSPEWSGNAPFTFSPFLHQDIEIRGWKKMWGNAHFLFDIGFYKLAN